MSCTAIVQLSQTVGVIEACQLQVKLNFFVNSVGRNFENIRFVGHRSTTTFLVLLSSL